LPLIKILSKPSYKIGIWELSNSEYDSNHCGIIHPNYHKEFNEFKNEKRKWQIYGTKMLFNELCNEGDLVSKNRIPQIENLNKDISITHTNQIIAIIIADYPCGIDIESRDRDVSRIKHKFLNKEDFTNGNHLENLIQNWCMKEVLYKIKKDNTVLFKDHLIIKKNYIGFSGYCKHPEFSFSSNIKLIEYNNYFLAFNLDYIENHD
jgi:hypothetical protein